MTFVVTQGCVDILDKTCMTVCPVDCIYEGDRMMYINPVECVDCGACEPVCPQGAIFYDDEVPPELSAFIEGNRAFFAENEASGGARDVGRIGADSRALIPLFVTMAHDSAEKGA